MSRISTKMFYISLLGAILTFSSCIFFRKDKDPEKLVRDANGAIEFVLEKIDTLEERAKKLSESNTSDSVKHKSDSLNLDF